MRPFHPIALASGRMLQLALLLAMATSHVDAAAQAPTDAAQRAQIASARQELERRYKQAQGECRERFVVTPCLDDAKRERRRGLAELRERELRLDEVERRQRAASRNEAVTRKQAELEAAANRAAASASEPAAAASRPLLRPSARASESLPHVSRPPMDATAEVAASRVERAQARERGAMERHQRIEQRQRERAARAASAPASKSAPLPAPTKDR